MAKKLNVVVPGSNPAEDLVKEVAGEKQAVVKKQQAKKSVSKSEPIVVAKKEVKELKSVQVNLRMKASVKAEFEKLCAEYGYSQSEFFEIMLDVLKKQLAK